LPFFTVSGNGAVAFVGAALHLDEILDRELVEIGHGLDDLEFGEVAEDALAEAFDVHRAARREVLDAAAHLRGADHAAGAPPRGLLGIALELRAALRALRGISNGFAPFGRFSSTTATSCGITSPARRITTVSPTRTSSRLTWSSLNSVTLVTVTPETCTGSSTATGVTFPCARR
jgi:hypothetical protein